MFCQYCGGKIDKENAKFCKSCGKPLNEAGGKYGSDTHGEKGAGSKVNPHSTNAFLKRFWPDMATDKACIGAAKVASSVSGFIAVVTAMTGYFELLGASKLALIDAILFGLIAFFIWKMSRVAAVAGLILYLFEVWFTISARDTNAWTWIVVILFIYAFVNSVRGTFAYQKLRE